MKKVLFVKDDGKIDTKQQSFIKENKLKGLYFVNSFIYIPNLFI